MRDVVRAGDRTRAAIAGRRAAEIYGGVILREHLEDNSENYTRFILLSPSHNRPENADKLSLVFQLDHRPRALFIGARAVRAARYQFDEDRKPARARTPVAVPVLSGPCRRRGAIRKLSRRSAELEKLVVELRILGRTPPRQAIGSKSKS